MNEISVRHFADEFTANLCGWGEWQLFIFFFLKHP